MISNFVMGVNFTKLRPHPTGHFRLSHEYRTIKAVSLMNCLIQNRLDNNCKAVTYNERFRYCKLNDKSGIYDSIQRTLTDGKLIMFLMRLLVKNQVCYVFLGQKGRLVIMQSGLFAVRL